MGNRELLEFAEELARGGGRILRKSYGRQQTIHFKGEINLVTDVDTNRSGISSADPGAVPGPRGDVGGEPGAAFPVAVPVDRRSPRRNHELRARLPVLLRLRGRGAGRRGRGRCGVRPPARRIVHGGEREGAFRNGERIAVSKIAELRKSLLATGFAYDVNTSTDDNFDYFRAFVLTGQAIRRDGSAALDLCYLACGRFDGFWS